MNKGNEGRYQCIVSNSIESVTKVAELKVIDEEDSHCDFDDYTCIASYCLLYKSRCSGVEKCPYSDYEKHCDKCKYELSKYSESIWAWKSNFNYFKSHFQNLFTLIQIAQRMNSHARIIHVFQNQAFVMKSMTVSTAKMNMLDALMRADFRSVIFLDIIYAK